jgi:inosine-uridine nucleoside N-ribohydrolase
MAEKSDSCGEGIDMLQLLPDGTLGFTSTGDFGTNEGILVRANESRPLPVIFDDDGSPDGTVALLYLLSDPAVEVKGVVISHGEARPQVYIQHIGRILADWDYKEIPLGAGADTALIPGEDFPEWLRDAADNFWGFAKANDLRTFPVQNGADLMVKLLKEAEEPMAVFVSGPCTDLALTLRQDPAIKEKISGVYIMGGAVYTKGNLTDFSANPQNTSAEWNIYIDPLAAAEVVSAGVPVTIVPLDATNLVSATTADTKAWREGDAKADLAADFYDMLLGGDPNKTMMLWDVMTAAVMANPELCPTKPLRLEVNTSPGNHYGQTVVIGVGEPNTEVCLKPDGPGIKERLRVEFGE